MLAALVWCLTASNQCCSVHSYMETSCYNKGQGEGSSGQHHEWQQCDEDIHSLTNGPQDRPTLARSCIVCRHPYQCSQATHLNHRRLAEDHVTKELFPPLYLAKELGNVRYAARHAGPCKHSGVIILRQATQQAGLSTLQAMSYLLTSKACSRSMRSLTH